MAVPKHASDAFSRAGGLSFTKGLLIDGDPGARKDEADSPACLLDCLTAVNSGVSGMRRRMKTPTARTMRFRRNGIRQPQAMNCSAEISVAKSTAAAG
jgi:hypothetical protein